MNRTSLFVFFLFELLSYPVQKVSKLNEFFHNYTIVIITFHVCFLNRLFNYNSVFRNFFWLLLKQPETFKYWNVNSYAHLANS